MQNVNKEIAVRRARNVDSKFIMDLIFGIWIDEYHFEVKRENFPDLQEIETYYPNGKGLFLVAIADDKIVGTIAYDTLSEQNFVLKRMFVSKAYRGLGVAQSLLDTLLTSLSAETKNKNISIFLSTKESEAIAAKKFYLKNDFCIVSKSELPKNFPFFYKDDLFMRKSSNKSK